MKSIVWICLYLGTIKCMCEDDVVVNCDIVIFKGNFVLWWPFTQTDGVLEFWLVLGNKTNMRGVIKRKFNEKS